MSYARGLCAKRSDPLTTRVRTDVEQELHLPDLRLPPVKMADLPDPIVCAEHVPPVVPRNTPRAPCP